MIRRRRILATTTAPLRGAVLVEMILLISLIALSSFVVLEDFGIEVGCKLTEIYRPKATGELGPKEIMEPCCEGILLCGPGDMCMCVG